MIYVYAVAAEQDDVVVGYVHLPHVTYFARGR